MRFNHVHFYLEDAIALRNCLIEAFGFQAIAHYADSHTQTYILNSGSIWFLLSSPLTHQSPVAKFLREHPPGVADVAFQVDNLAAVMAQARQQGATITHSLICQGSMCWGQIQGWDHLRHTLVEQPRDGSTIIPVWLDEQAELYTYAPLGRLVGTLDQDCATPTFLTIDHVVLNVPMGQLTQAANWYSNLFGFQPGQQFLIQTDYSALRSLVLACGAVQFPINEPASATSQIQEFLDENRGAGIQHIALRTANIVAAVEQLRSSNIPLISVPKAYYQQLQRDYPQAIDWTTIAANQILADWHENAVSALLLQTFTNPMFARPTFFFEIIERQGYWHQGSYQLVQGFGERNFLALVKAIEQEQLSRQSAQKATNEPQHK